MSNKQKLTIFNKNNFNSIDYKEEIYKETIYITTSLNRTIYYCPICNSNNIIKNGFNKRTIYHNTDLVWKYVFNIKIPKYNCKNCNNYLFKKCSFALKNSSFSLETIFSVLNLLKDISSSFASVARTMRISTQQCMNIFNKFVADPPTTPIFPEIISFDEKFLN